MPHNLLRELSPREECTLCRIAQGIASWASLRHGDISRLQNFGFVETSGGVPALTPLGTRRVEIVNRTTTS